MAWNSRTNLRALETTTHLIVAICRQMEDWRRILRYVERLQRDEEGAEPVLAEVRLGAQERPASL